MFSAGHLGGLTRYLPFELVDAVLEETRRVQRRLRALPSRAGVYFVLALALFPELGYLGVWDKMTGELKGTAPRPSEKALRDLRRRVGAAALKALFEVAAGPLAWPRTPGACYRGLRTVAFDGCSSIRVPDLEPNRRWLGKAGTAGYPAVRLMALAETGTRGLLGAVFGPCSTGEREYASRLLHLLGPDMLVLADRGFDADDFLAAVARTRAQFLIRLDAGRRPPVLQALQDGSFLSRIGGVEVRVIDASVTVTCKDGTVLHDSYRLATTLADSRRHPAGTLVRLYHERWEIESAFYALRHTMMNGRVLRSGDPAGLEQELWAILTACQLLRAAMTDAAESRPGTDPDRASFTVALQAARDQVTRAAGIFPATPGSLAGAIGDAVLARLLPARRPRVSVRKVKSPVSRYNARPAGDTRPLASQDITGLAITIHQGQPAPPPRPGSRPGRLDQVLALLAADPARTWTARDIAGALATPGPRRAGLRQQLTRWARLGLIRKQARGTYIAAAPEPPPPRQPGKSPKPPEHPT